MSRLLKKLTNLKIFSLQPISSIWPVSIFIDFLIHLPYCILPYSALVMNTTCPEVQLALKVSQLQYCLLKPAEKYLSGFYRCLFLLIASASATWKTYLELGFPFPRHPDRMALGNRKAYVMMFSLHPTSSISPVSGFIDFQIHLPYCILPYSALVMNTTCPEVQLALKVSQLQYCLVKPAEKYLPALYSCFL